MEIWKYINGYRNKYMVSNYGNVKSLNFNKEKILNPSLSNGYKKITLRENGKPKDFYVHRLVAFAFIENPNNYNVINHINGIKTDNRVENLEWCTFAHNNKHAIETKLRIPLDGENAGGSKLTSEQVTLIRNRVMNGEKMRALGREFNVYGSTISRIVSKQTYKNI